MTDRRPARKSWAGWVVRGGCVVAATAMGLSACSDGGGPVVAPETSSASATGGDGSSVTAPGSDSAGSGSAGNQADQPVSVATIPSDLPEVMKGQVGEVEVIGKPLPLLQTGIEADPARGQMAPVVVGRGFDGKEMRIDAAASGRPTVIYFLAHWCPHCNAEVPIINQLRDSNAFRPDLDIYAISEKPRANSANFPPSQWIKDVDWTYPVMPDGVGPGESGYLAADSFGLDGYPMAVLINADGTVAARFGPTENGDEIISNINTYLSY